MPLRTIKKSDSLTDESNDAADYGDESSNNAEDFDENDLDSDFEEQLDEARARKRKHREHQ